MQGVADKFTAYYEEKATEEAELIWTQAQADWTRNLKASAKTAGDGFTGTTMQDYDAYVDGVMKTVPLRRVDDMQHAFAKQRIGVEAQAMEIEAAARARARAANQAKIQDNRHTTALELIEAGHDPAAVMNAMRYNSAGELLDKKEQRALLGVVSKYVMDLGDKEALAGFNEDLVEDDRFNDITSASERIDLRADIERKLNTITANDRVEAEFNADEYVRRTYAGEDVSDIDIGSALADMSPEKAEAAIEDINVAESVVDEMQDTAVMPESQLEEILVSLQPEGGPGSETAVQERVRQEVETRIEELRNERHRNPHAAAMNFPSVSEAWDRVNATAGTPEHKAAMTDYIKKTTLVQQRNFNIAPSGVSHLPKEAIIHVADQVRTVTRRSYGNQRDADIAMTALYMSLQDIVGEYADEVLIEAMGLLRDDRTPDAQDPEERFVKQLIGVNRGRTPGFTDLTPPSTGPTDEPTPWYDFRSWFGGTTEDEQLAERRRNQEMEE